MKCPLSTIPTKIKAYGHSQAVVPVSSAKQELSIMRNHKQPGRDLHSRRERTGQKTLRPAETQRRRQHKTIRAAATNQEKFPFSLKNKSPFYCSLSLLVFSDYSLYVALEGIV